MFHCNFYINNVMYYVYVPYTTQPSGLNILCAYSVNLRNRFEMGWGHRGWKTVTPEDKTILARGCRIPSLQGSLYLLMSATEADESWECIS